MSNLPAKSASIALMEQYIKDPSLRNHCQMVAAAMAAYAQALGEDEELWFATGLLHDLDWEMYPDEHPKRAVAELLNDYPAELKQAALAHAPGITGIQPETLMERYLFACDEICGLMNAAALMRPGRFSDMAVKSVKKKIKDKSFAANVSRDDINLGFELINQTPELHIEFLINVFRGW